MAENAYTRHPPGVGLAKRAGMKRPGRSEIYMADFRGKKALLGQDRSLCEDMRKDATVHVDLRKIPLDKGFFCVERII